MNILTPSYLLFDGIGKDGSIYKLYNILVFALWILLLFSKSCFTYAVRSILF